jgi:hypothetical protein
MKTINMRPRLIFLSSFFLLACNNETKTSSDPNKPVDAKAVNETNSGSACSRLVLFEEGAIVESITYDGNDKEIARGQSVVKKVGEENGFTTSQVEMSSGKGHSITAKYRCGNSRLYVDLASIMSNFSANKNFTIDASDIEFPIDLSEGEQLPDASYTLHMSMGNKEMAMVTTIKDRKVEAKEKITTAAGSWDCYRVSAKVEAQMENSPMNKAINAAVGSKRMVMWFAPDFGIVKSAMYDGDRLTSHSEITSVKK